MSEYPTKQEIYAYLEGVRKYGIINMFESPILLQNQFGFSKERSMELFLDWSREGPHTKEEQNV